jgi:hypothetical protein
MAAVHDAIVIVMYQERFGQSSIVVIFTAMFFTAGCID